MGKSSTVNVLVEAKKTSVSATPGKTKHFQTLSVPGVKDVLLCDCPGLVFPTLAGSKAQMVCDGILPIDQMKEYIEPMRELLARVSVEQFERTYVLKLRPDAEREDDPDAPELAREMLMAHALARGFMTNTKGTPDEARSARVLLKDYVNAKLLHVHVPPGANAFDGAGASSERQPPPQAPTAARWLDKMKADYEAQEGIHLGTSSGNKRPGSGRRGRAEKESGAMRSVQWRPTGGSALPDRLVATGRRVEMVQVDLA